MFSRIKIGVLVIAMFAIKSSWSIRASLDAIPSVVKRGGHAAIQCLYELEGSPLYTVKWYRGQHEFYRYTPGDIPPQKFFQVKGINVDSSLSNETQVMLKELEFSMSGNFSCEVSADAPSYSTAYVTNTLDVVSPPESGPIIRTNQNQYDTGDLLRAKCSAPPSKPAANLTFLINNQAMSFASRKVKEENDGLESSDLYLNLSLTASHFRNNRMILRCMAQLHPLYVESATATFALKSDPKSERITSPTSFSTTFTANIILILLMSLLGALASIDYDSYFYDYGDQMQSDDISDALRDKLLGM